MLQVQVTEALFRHHTGALVERLQAHLRIFFHPHRWYFGFQHLEQVVVHVVVGSFGQYEICRERRGISRNMYKRMTDRQRNQQNELTDMGELFDLNGFGVEFHYQTDGVSMKRARKE